MDTFNVAPSLLGSFSFKIEEMKEEVKEEASEMEEIYNLHPWVEMRRLSEVEVVTLINAQRVEVSTIPRGSGSRYFFRKKIRVTINLI